MKNGKLFHSANNWKILLKMTYNPSAWDVAFGYKHRKIRGNFLHSRASALETLSIKQNVNKSRFLYTLETFCLFYIVITHRNKIVRLSLRSLIVGGWDHGILLCETNAKHSRNTRDYLLLPSAGDPLSVRSWDSIINWDWSRALPQTGRFCLSTKDWLSLPPFGWTSFPGAV